MKESIPRPSLRRTGSPCFDRARLLELVDHDLGLLREIVVLLFEDTPGWLDSLEDAGAAGDGEALRSAAHALKGALCNFAADRASAMAGTLEEMGRTEELDGVPGLVANLVEEIAVLSAELEALVTES